MELYRGKISVLMPAYNESDHIYQNVRETWKVFLKTKCVFEIVIVDDGSTDETRTEAERAASEYDNVHVVHYSNNNGAGGPGSPVLRWLILAVFAVPYLLAAHYYGSSYNWTFISAKQPEYLASVWGWMDRNNDTRGRVIETCGIPTAMILGQRMLPNQVDLLERYQKKDYLDDYLALMGFRYVITPSMHSQRNKTFDVRGYTPPSVFDRGERMNEYYSALTTEYYHIYERLNGDASFALNTAGTRDVAIFENLSAFADYELYAARPVMVFGGTDSYDLLNLDRYRVSEADSSGALRPAAVFVAQSDNLERLDEIRTVSKDLVLHNTDAVDLYLYLNQDELSIGRPVPKDPENWSLAIYSFGIQQPFLALDHSIGNSLHGEMTFADYAITASRAGSRVERGFSVAKDGRYAVMLRSYGGPGYSGLSAALDNGPPVSISQEGHGGYAWLTLWEGELAAGEHSVDVTLTDDRPVFIDSVAVVPAGILEDGAAQALSRFEGAASTYIANHRRFTIDKLEGTATTRLSTGRTGRYTPSLRLGRHAEIKSGGVVTLLVDGRISGSVDLDSLSNEPRLFSLHPIDLGAGPHTLTVKGLVDGVYFDLVSVAEEPMADGPETGLPGGDKAIRYERTGPSEYTVSTEGLEPGTRAFVVFNETNHPGWVMEAGGERHRPVVANMFMNGFIIEAGQDGTGAVIRYTEPVHRAGVAVSGLTLAAIVVVSIVGWRRSSR